jgi:hypothetical protein
MLHVTNGDSVSLRDSGLPGEEIAWIDVLHEGPAPAALTLEEFSAVRAPFLASLSGGAVGEIQARFDQRNAALARFAEHDEVVLWFEHDLYDQLQLIQVLDWLLTHPRGACRLSLICAGKFPGIGRFKGVGQLSGAQLGTLFLDRQPITLADLKQASMAWTAFCSPDPTEIEFVIEHPSPALPYLKGALYRHLQQFPAEENGLARTERQILEIVERESLRFEDLFLSDQDREERVFMSEAILRTYVERMAVAPNPLVEMTAGVVRITPLGVKVLRGSADAVRLNGIDRWLGGVHLAGSEAAWRWDEKNGRLARKDPSGADRN